MGNILIVTGMSGAGKTIALKTLEDLGWYCVDNLPVPLIDKFSELINDSRGEFTKCALGVDIRSGKELPLLKEILEKWKKSADVDCQLLFLDASDEVLIKRFKETRRAHPLSKDGRVETGIIEERNQLEWLKKGADIIIDTSHLLTKELRAQLSDIYVGNHEYENLQVTIVSFGFKYGIPEDADLLFDVRFLPNPYYVSELRSHTGLEKEIQEYVQQGGTADEFLKMLYDMIQFLIPNYIKEGKNQLVIGIGCTGGKHRSVTISELLYQALKKNADYGLKIDHRDIGK